MSKLIFDLWSHLVLNNLSINDSKPNIIIILADDAGYQTKSFCLTSDFLHVSWALMIQSQIL